MKKILPIGICLIMNLGIAAQNSPACDSLIIDCCSFNLTAYTVSLVASNYLSYLFDYPGFILFNNSMDTVAIEEVIYFGIGTGQTHTMDIVHPFNLPFEGILKLYTLFYDTLWCTYQVLIPDTISAEVSNELISSFMIYPNPAEYYVCLKPHNRFTSSFKALKIIDTMGQICFSGIIPPEGLYLYTDRIGKGGIYFVKIENKEGAPAYTSRLIIR
jgi:hypothetical protein